MPLLSLGLPVFRRTGLDYARQRADLFARAKFFDYVHAYAKAGGDDSATLFDSPKKDVLIATPTYARMRGKGFNNRVKFFDEVYAEASQGDDFAGLFDTPNNDHLVAAGNSAALWTGFGGLDLLYEIAGFDATMPDTATP